MPTLVEKIQPDKLKEEEKELIGQKRISAVEGWKRRKKAVNWGCECFE
ncbi:hypothetical protein RYX51_18775 [Priestia filamentosa]|nr:hypothetical protein RYX51_18775 [Priestia filamentosa]